MGRDGDVELIEQPLLIGCRCGHPAEADFSAVGRRQHNIRALQRRELGERARRREAGSFDTASLASLSAGDGRGDRGCMPPVFTSASNTFVVTRPHPV